ncbi:MAG: diaminopimelate decarboxylase [Planctomycetota bacterium]
MKPAALADELLQRLAHEHGTPLYAYHLPTAVDQVRRLAGEFDVVRYAQKANAHPALLRALRKAGAKIDASSAGEVRRALEAGFAPEEIVLTCDLFDRDMLALIAEQPVGVNLGSPFQIEQLARARPGAAATLRINPGFGAGHDRRVTTGGLRSKHGVWYEDVPQSVRRAREAGIALEGLHVHVGSGAPLAALLRSRDVLRRAARELGDGLRVLSAGGGLTIPYRQGEPRFDVAGYATAWRELRDSLPTRPTLEVEPGRYVAAECGVLITEVRGTKRVGPSEFVLVDAGFHNLIRPALYGSYHRITALGKRGEPLSPRCVAGPLCEAADVFTQDKEGGLQAQPLPALSEGDLLCIHDTGAYGASMASDYNLQRRAAEVALDAGGSEVAP